MCGIGVGVAEARVRVVFDLSESCRNVGHLEARRWSFYALLCSAESCLDCKRANTNTQKGWKRWFNRDMEAETLPLSSVSPLAKS
jgi:hypothetical protein